MRWTIHFSNKCSIFQKFVSYSLQLTTVVAVDVDGFQTTEPYSRVEHLEVLSIIKFLEGIRECDIRGNGFKKILTSLKLYNILFQRENRTKNKINLKSLIRKVNRRALNYFK